MSKKRVRVGYGKMGRAGNAVFTVVSFFFIIIGVTQAIPGAGLFGVVWTLIACAFFGFGVYGLVTGKDAYGREIIIEEEDAGGHPAGGSRPAEGSDVEARLMRLEQLYERRVITREEYEAQRAEIIRGL